MGVFIQQQMMESFVITIKHSVKKYVRYIDAEDAGWDYINSRKTMQAWRGSIRSFDEALAS